MENFSCFVRKLCCLNNCWCVKLVCFARSIHRLLSCFCRFIFCRFESFFMQLFYFIFLSFLGFCVLKSLNPRTLDSFKPRDLDLFFTSVSAATVSSMSTVEMEVFSNSQLVVMIVLMFIGSEVFTSMVGLFGRISKLGEISNLDAKVESVSSASEHIGEVELGVVDVNRALDNLESGNVAVLNAFQPDAYGDEHFIIVCIKILAFVALGYLLIVQVLGIALVSLYLAVESSANNVLKTKKLNPFTFSVFTVVSTFASCGFVPTNENMVLFRRNSGLLLALIPQALLGNTLYPPCLRASIVASSKIFKKKKDEFGFLLKNTCELRFLHLFPGLRSWFLVVTVLVFVVIQFVMLCSMEWDSESLSGLTAYQKTIGLLFQSVNSRHTGETIVDISIISPAILVVFVVMMYLPPYTSFYRTNIKTQEMIQKRRGKIAENVIFSQLSYLAIFVVLICITERKKMKDDPLNFSVLNIVVEVISAYGNVGFTTGYSCKRRLSPDGSCQNKWYGFAGRWSYQGKAILIVVMLVGRLKKFNMNGGKAWKLL